MKLTHVSAMFMEYDGNRVWTVMECRAYIVHLIILYSHNNT